MADIVAQLVRQMAEQRQQPAPSADPIMAWEFQVTYDDSHPVQRIKSMRATAIRGKAA